MTCDRIDSRLDDYVDGTLDVAARQAVEMHLATCADCRAAVDETRAIRDAAATLEQHVPPPQLWGRIAAAVDAETRRPWWHLGGMHFAAAAATIAIIAGVGAMAWRDLGSAAAGTVATATGPAVNGAAVPLVNTSVTQAAVEYTQAIANLEAMRQADGAQLDPMTADVMQANIAIVDDAIEQSRTALQTDPENEVAQQSFFEALQSKVELLQNAIALINEMRQGDQAGAAAIVSGQNP